MAHEGNKGPRGAGDKGNLPWFIAAKKRRSEKRKREKTARKKNRR